MHWLRLRDVRGGDCLETAQNCWLIEKQIELFFQLFQVLMNGNLRRRPRNEVIVFVEIYLQLDLVWRGLQRLRHIYWSGKFYIIFAHNANNIRLRMLISISLFNFI